MLQLQNLSKKVTLVLVLLFTFIISIFPMGNVAKADSLNTYVALGDSIANGYSATPGKGYTDLFYNYLKTTGKYPNLQLQNLSKLGDTSSILLNKIQQDAAFRDSIKKASVITISIGGNNLMAPTISTIAKTFGANTSFYDPEFPTKLANAIKENPDKVKNVFTLMTSKSLPNALDSGVTVFNTDWPLLIKTIKTLSPNSKIIVMTLYNPFTPGDLFYSTFDKYVQAINTSIKKENKEYIVADVYTAFKNHKGQPATNLDVWEGVIDPHPNNLGYEMISKTHIDALKESYVYKETKAPASTPVNSSADSLNLSLIRVLLSASGFVIFATLLFRNIKRKYTF